MGLLNKALRAVSARRNKRLEEAPRSLLPSEIHAAVANPSRYEKRLNKLEVRRQYRCRALRGIMDSRTRQILAEGGARSNFERIEAEARRQAEEDELYGVGAAA